MMKKANYVANQLTIVAEIISVYKKLGYKVVDGNESIMICEPNSTFRIFISRVSHILQFYYLGEWQDTQQFSTKDLDSAAQIPQLEAKYKELFG